MPRLPTISKYWVVCRSGGLAVVEGVAHAHALVGLLLDAVHEDRLGQARRVQDGGRHVDHVAELGADLAPGLDPLGQWTMVPLRVPPQCEATCLVHW